MAFKIYNTLARKKEEFTPIEDRKVCLYTCGPTVYDYAHIGNFRAYICGDILKRYLEYKGYKVNHVMNLTDVDDKTIKNSIRAGTGLDDYTRKYKEAFFEDLKRLNIEPADVFPEATKHIKEMVSLIKKLLEKGLAYKGDDGTTYYSVAKFRDYGKLSRINAGELKAGARVSQDEYEKENISDFALWKAWDRDDGDVFWETDLGKGRPGWHIECSAMSMKYLGDTFDIHCGGIDLIFPHHENEIAQSEGATGKQFVNYWFHNEWLLVESKKMSKSLGNFYTIRDLLDKGYSPLAIRYLLMSAHYRQRLNFTMEGLDAAKNTLQRLYDFMDSMGMAKGEEENKKVEVLVKTVAAKFESEMDDDLNISNALAAIFDFMKEINKMEIGRKDALKVEDVMLKFNKVLGVLGKKEEKIPEEVSRLVKERETARKGRDFKAADELRDKINALGYSVEDMPEGAARVKKIS